MFSVTKKYVLTVAVCLLGIGQGFGATPVVYDCSTGATWGGYTLEEASDSDGDGYYEIDTPGKLAWFSCNINNNHGDYASDNAKLTADIKMNSDDANEADKNYWIPICAGTGGVAKDKIKYCKYSGVFDGNNHKISNLYLNSDFLEQINVYFTQNVGFIGAFENGTVKKLILENVQVLGSGDGGKNVTGGNCIVKPVSIGTLVGWSNGSVENCIVSGTIVTSGVGQAVGGLVGNAGGGSITGSVSEVAIDASGLAYAGGIVGYTKNTVSISSCVYAGSGVSSEGFADVNGTTYYSKAGGIVGSRYSGTVTATNVYYDNSNENGTVIGAIGNGNLGSSSSTQGSSDVNNEETVCVLNGGTWSAETKTCDGGSSAWSVGFSGLSYEGSDGYMVTFDANGGEFPSGAKKYNVVINGTTITVKGISIPSRDGHVFLGWSRSKNAITPDEDLGEVNGQTTVYAVWNPMIEITFNANDGYFPPDPSTTTKTKLVPTGDPITVEGIEPLPEKYCTGTVNGEECVGGVWMYFRGWSFNNKASVSDAIDLNQLTTYASSENTTLYAIWTEVETYTVTFHAEGHGKTKVAFTETEVEAGGHVDEPEEGFAVPDEGYLFDGWWTEEIGGEKFKFNTEITQSIILHAHWKTAEYDIVYTNAPSDANHEKYTIESDFTFYTPTQTGYTFDGWFYDDQFSTKAEGVKPGATGKLTIYAKWSEATYTIAYRAGTGGDGEILPEKVAYGTSYTLKGASYTRDGYFQDGWSSSNNGAKEYELKAVLTITENLELYPHWVRGVKSGAITITENADGTKSAVINGVYGRLNNNSAPIPEEADAVEITENIEVSSVTLNRTFNANHISTLYVPFEIDADDVKNATIYKFKNVVWNEDDQRWKFKVAQTAKILPNTPYVVLPSASQVTFDYSGTVTFNTTTPGENAVSKDGCWEFKGLYKYTKFIMDDVNPIYVFANEERNDARLGEFVKTSEGAWSNPMRAYLVYHKGNALTKSANGRLGGSVTLPDELDIVVEDEQGIVVETGRLNMVTGEVKMDRWFDLKGRKLNSRPSVKGTYYKNGKKVIIK